MNRVKLFEKIEKGEPVKFNESRYIPNAYILRYKNGQWLHSAELYRKNTNSVIIASLDMLKE